MRPPLIAVLLASASADEPTDRWEPLRSLLSEWQFTSEYAVSIGDARGRQFLFEGGNFTMDTLIKTGSTSKWPSAMMFAGLVNDGTIASLDSHVYEYIPWWTRNASDLRSRVTLRMLLSFTSGFGSGHPGQEANTRAARAWRIAQGQTGRPISLGILETLALDGVDSNRSQYCNTTTGNLSACVEAIYENVTLIGTPGQVFSYNSNHLQIAAEMAVAASGLPIHTLIHKYLLEPYGMNASYYDGQCPDFGGSLMTTGRDYERFLSGVLTHRVLSPSLTRASERDYTPFLKDNYTLYGDYAFGHFKLCFDSVDGYTSACEQAQCHMDPGAYGFIPIIDRKHGYYLQVVAAETAPTGYYPLSGIPEYLAIAIKPHVDAIMSASPPGADVHYHHTPSLLSLTVADVNYCLDCKLNPEHCN